MKTGSNSNMIDFSPTQKMPGIPSPLNSFSSKAQFPETHTSLSTLGGDGGQLLHKLVAAISHALPWLFALLRGLQPQSSAHPQQSHREQAPPSSQPSSRSSTTSPATLPVTPEKAEKPFVVQHTHPSDKPVVLATHKSATPSAVPTPAVDKTDTTAKVTKPAPRAAHGQGADMSGMVGFAKESNTTGGNNGEVVTVNTVADLKKNLEDDTARTVRLGADLSADSKVTIKFGANKTLLGTDGGNSLHNIYLASGKTASNDIFQNLNFTHDSRYRENGDMQMFISSGQKYWIDHNTYSGTKDQNPKGLDKLLYVGGTADNVSLTNSKFQNNEYGVILGQPDDSAAAKAAYAGYPRMTIANNSFNNLDVRAPGLMRHGNFDVYNNLIDNFHLGFTATGDAHILSQANYFENGEDVAKRASNTGVLDDYGDAHFKDIGSNVSFNQKSPVTVWTPSYNRDVKTAEEAKAYDLANAGAKNVK
jgi:pectin lyase